jgi:hypothetical protein
MNGTFMAIVICRSKGRVPGPRCGMPSNRYCDEIAADPDLERNTSSMF